MSKEDDFYKKTLGPVLEETEDRFYYRKCQRCQFMHTYYQKNAYPKYCEKCKHRLQDK